MGCSGDGGSFETRGHLAWAVQAIELMFDVLSNALVGRYSADVDRVLVARLYGAAGRHASHGIAEEPAIAELHEITTRPDLLGRAAAGEDRLAPYSEVDEAVRPLLEEFGPPRKSYHTEYPFWYLQNDGLWEVTGVTGAQVREGKASQPTKGELVRLDVLLAGDPVDARVVNTVSSVGLYGHPGQANYAASKAGMVGMTKSLAAELAGRSITVNCIAPGFIDSEMLRNVMDKDPERRKKVLGRTPMKRFGTAEEIGYAAAFLASDASKFITGICLPVDGGNSIGF